MRNVVHYSIKSPTNQALQPMAINAKNVRFVTQFPVHLKLNSDQLLSILFHFQCHGHSNECYYNPEVDQRGLSINTDGVYSGGGVCLNCTVCSIVSVHAYDHFIFEPIF